MSIQCNNLLCLLRLSSVKPFAAICTGKRATKRKILLRGYIYFGLLLAKWITRKGKYVPVYHHAADCDTHHPVDCDEGSTAAAADSSALPTGASLCCLSTRNFTTVCLIKPRFQFLVGHNIMARPFFSYSKAGAASLPLLNATKCVAALD